MGKEVKEKQMQVVNLNFQVFQGKSKNHRFKKGK
jgi:hypothetical protein